MCFLQIYGSLHGQIKLTSHGGFVRTVNGRIVFIPLIIHTKTLTRNLIPAHILQMTFSFIDLFNHLLNHAEHERRLILWETKSVVKSNEARCGKQINLAVTRCTEQNRIAISLNYQLTFGTSFAKVCMIKEIYLILCWSALNFVHFTHNNVSIP